MNKPILLPLIFFVFLSSFLSAQFTSGGSVATLEVNNVKAYLPMSNLWLNGNKAGYIFPYDPKAPVEVASIFAGSLWFGGLDPAGNLKLSAATYGTAIGESDYWAGPLNPETGLTDNETSLNWDKHFKTSSFDITIFLADVIDGTIDNPIPQSLLGWPAKGNPHFFDIHSFELPNTSQELAPFWDENGDNLYNPEDGDYPVLNISDEELGAQFADEMVFWIYNDTGAPSNLNTLSLQFEIHMMAYAYASSNTHLNNTTFYDVKMINRAQETLDSTFVSLWMDADLGCFTDDYFGCLPEEDMMFVYNEDELDGSSGCSCEGGVNTYCGAVPMLGVKLLKSPLGSFNFDDNGDLIPTPFGQTPDTFAETGMSSFIMYKNAYIGNPEPNMTDPNGASEYYNYMNGRFRDNSPIIYEGEETKFMFSGNPENNEEWSMCSENPSLQDRRTVMSAGSFRLDPGAANQMTFCVTHVENVAHPCPNTDILVEALDEVETFYKGGTISSIENVIANHSSIKVVPNPIMDIASIRLENNIAVAFQKLHLFNASGQLVREISPENEQEFKILKEDLKAGIYFYQIITSTEDLFTGKFIIL